MEHGTRNMEQVAAPRPSFMKLTAWQSADEMASLIFRSVQKLPAQHRWLGLQAARAAVSVPANIAEGYGRGSLADYLRFLDIARGSLSEVQYNVHFLGKEHLLADDDLKQLKKSRADAGRLLHGLWLTLKSKPQSSWDHSGQIREIATELYVADDE